VLPLFKLGKETEMERIYCEGDGGLFEETEEMKITEQRWRDRDKVM
jgi:hypothetical protein